MNPAAPPALMNFLPIIFIIAIFYFLLIRPQQKQAKEHQKMLEGLKVGDKILTTGGIIGTIAGIKGRELEVKIAENVKVTIVRAAVASLAGQENASSQA